MRLSTCLPLGFLAILTAACGDDRCEEGAECPGYEIGKGDGTPDSVTFVPVFEPDEPREPADLAFNPSNLTEMWMINRKDDSVVILSDVSSPNSSSTHLRDPAADHFMNLPPALAFGAVTEAYGQTWATCGDNDNGGNDFMGPSLFSADLSIFAQPTPDGLGSHLDMLHSTIFCRGIAHMEANVYWVFNSDQGSLDKYDFHLDHGPGHDNHSDGEIYRYARGQIAGVEGVPSHLAYDPEDAHLYVADTGNKRVAKLDTKSGIMGDDFSGLEPIGARRLVEAATLTDVVPPGTLEAPSGVEIHNGLIYVSDHTTSIFSVFDRSGALVGTLDTGLPPGSLAGFNFGPDGKIYFADLISGRIYRIDP